MAISEKPTFGKTTQISHQSEEERLRRDIYRPDMEKFQLFMQMLRNNTVYKKVKIIHK
jgi:hypothetical protein